MRAWAAAAALLLLGGCGDRRDFDQRYNDTSDKLEEKARRLDQNITAEQADEPANLVDR